MDREILFRGQTRKYGEKVAVGTREKLPGQNDLGYWHKCPYCAVCGNIHDNPELLKEVK